MLQAEAIRLEELRLVGIEELVRLELDLNISPALHAAELLALTRRHPFREKLHLLHMEALRLCDRRAEALAHYRDYRRFLVTELGIEPGLALRRKERELLHEGH